MLSCVRRVDRGTGHFTFGRETSLVAVSREIAQATVGREMAQVANDREIAGHN